MDDLLFVYGTLRRGHAMHRLLHPHATFVTAARVRGTLLDLGEYPGIVLHGTAMVFGEVFRLHAPADGAWAHLDAYEGTDESPPEFARARARVEDPSGAALHCWTYVYLGDVAAAVVIASGEYDPRASS